MDLCTCSASSPGLSGAISPFAKTDRLWFNAENEPENQDYEIYDELCKYKDEHNDGIPHIGYIHDNPIDYYKNRHNAEKFLDSFIVTTKYNDPAFNEEGIYTVKTVETEEFIEL